MTYTPNTEQSNFKEILGRFVQELAKDVAGRNQELSARVVELEDVRKAISNLLEDAEEDREKIMEAKARDEAILASIGDGLVATDVNAKIIFVNNAFERMLGWKEPELKGRSLFETVGAIDGGGREIPESERPIAKTITTRTPTTITGREAIMYKRKDGTVFPVAVTASPVIIGSVVIGAVEVFRDITLERELDRVKSEFISIASHQLRTPLTGIQWVVERFTKKEQLTPKGKEYLNDIHLSAKRLTELVDLLLNLSRIESGRGGTTPENLEVVDFVKSYLDECGPLLDKKGLEIVFNDHPSELMVKTDKSALRNIVQSLVSNAIEYTPDGGTVTVTIRKINDKFMIDIQDTGIGIPQAEQSHISERFVRASNAKLFKTDGTGIGLYIADWFAGRLGGKIWFESVENTGSTFHVELPLEFNSQGNQHAPRAT